MSEQENSGSNAVGGSVLVENSTSSRHKQPYRPNELQYESEKHHKVSRAPAVPSVGGELKHSAEESTLPVTEEISERMEHEYAISSEKHKQSIVKKLSSNTERRDYSPESIILATVEVDRKRGITTPLQPIPPATDTDILKDAKEGVHRADEDSITDEVPEVQTPEIARKHSEWSDDEEAGGLPRSESRASRVSRMHDIPLIETKKEISWNDEDLEKDKLKNMALKPHLERRASITPCFRSTGPNEGPSGISICLPRKSSRFVNKPSGISINISRRHTASKSKVSDDNHSNQKTKSNDKVNTEVSTGTFIQNVKGRVNNIQNKIKSAFHL